MQFYILAVEAGLWIFFKLEFQSLLSFILDAARGHWSLSAACCNVCKGCHPLYTKMCEFVEVTDDRRGPWDMGHGQVGNFIKSPQNKDRVGIWGLGCKIASALASWRDKYQSYRILQCVADSITVKIFNCRKAPAL